MGYRTEFIGKVGTDMHGNFLKKTLEEEDQRKYEKTVDYISGVLPEVFKTIEAPLQTLDRLVKEYNSEELLQACKRFEENYEFSGYTSAVLEEFRDILKFPKGGVKYHYDVDSGKSLVSVIHPNGYLWVFEVIDLCGDEEWKLYYEVSPEGVEYSHEEDKCRLTLFIYCKEDFAWKGTLPLNTIITITSFTRRKDLLTAEYLGPKIRSWIGPTYTMT